MRMRAVVKPVQTSQDLLSVILLHVLVLVHDIVVKPLQCHDIVLTMYMALYINKLSKSLVNFAGSRYTRIALKV